MLCIEEPENGIHPSRVPNLAELLRDYAVDVTDPVGADNPLRQVVLNTHSPEVARQLSFDELVFVERALTKKDGPISVLRPISDTWRAALANGMKAGVRPVDRQAVVDFIGGSPVNSDFDQLTLGVWVGQVNRQLTWSIVADGGTDRLLLCGRLARWPARQELSGIRTGACWESRIQPLDTRRCRRSASTSLN